MYTDGTSLPRAPRLHAEPPRSFVAPPTPKEGDPNVFHFRVETSPRSWREERITDVPRSVTNHSSEGFSWGYRGSSAQELALNILNYVYPPGTDGYEAIPCESGYASRTAFQLYGDYTSEIVSQIPHIGEFQITVEEVRAWVQTKSESIKAFPRSHLLPEFFSNATTTPLERRMHSDKPLSSQPATPTTVDQTEWDSLSQRWEDKHQELASINTRIRDSLYDHFRGVMTSARERNLDRDQRHRALYAEAFELGRRINAIDIELCRSETLARPHSATYISCTLPTGLAQAVDDLLLYYERESRCVRELYQRLGPVKIAADLMHNRVVPDISIIPTGPTLVAACRTREAWRAVEERIMGVGYPGCSGFCGVVAIGGEPTLVVAVPAWPETGWNLSDQKDFRSLLIHEREHAAQRVRDCLASSPEFLETPQPVESVVARCESSFMFECRAELLSYGLSADWNRGRQSDLKARGPMAPYDYPNLMRDFWLYSFSKMLPDLSVAEHVGVLNQAAQRFYSWRTECFKALSPLETVRQGGVHEAFRAIDLFPVESWPKHLRRMRDLNLF